MPILFITAIVLGLVGYILAKAKGRDRFLWTVLCFLFGIPVIILFFLPSETRLGAARQRSASLSRADEAKWRSLVELDADIAAAAVAARKFGDEYELLLAEKYMPLNDKAYLGAALDKVSQQAQIEEGESDELLRLKSLMDAGLLTESEYAKQESDLLTGRNRAKWIMLPLISVGAACLIISVFIYYARGLSLISAICAILYVGASRHKAITFAELSYRNVNKYIDATVTLISFLVSTFLWQFGHLNYRALFELSELFVYSISNIVPSIIPAALIIAVGNITPKNAATLTITSVVCVIIFNILMAYPVSYLVFGGVTGFGFNSIVYSSFIFSFLLPARYYYAVYRQQSPKQGA